MNFLKKTALIAMVALCFSSFAEAADTTATIEQPVEIVNPSTTAKVTNLPVASQVTSPTDNQEWPLIPLDIALITLGGVALANHASGSDKPKDSNQHLLEEELVEEEMHYHFNQHEPGSA
ncbi:hypothetical protein [Dongshaea marina]|uniref:hypothetical protein n=1 Tax=Dongshaea marina TaxID=2047966 RepID=UPI000D3E4840|nr:hypothetical protein [Dongshaea marina]